MGYELRLIIGQEWNHDSTIGGQFPHTIQNIAEIDLSNPGYNARIYALVGRYQKAQKAKLDAISTSPRSQKRKRASTIRYTDVIIGNREQYLYEDSYGMPLVSIPLSLFREALRGDWEDSKAEYSNQQIGYRRFYVALQLIDALIATFPDREVDDATRDVNPLAGQLVVIPWGH